MTSREFKRIALSFPETSEESHHGHPDFRVRGRIFATLGYPKAGWGMVKLTPEQQSEFMHDAPSVFVPVRGGWGRTGATNVALRPAKTAILRTALRAAWRNHAPKRVAEQSKETT
jgi:hypothetical protein